VGLVQKTASFKLTCRNCPPQHQRGIWQCAKSDGRLRSPAPLDVSFHCEGGLCLNSLADL
jgi:hypothetical protein